MAKKEDIYKNKFGGIKDVVDSAAPYVQKAMGEATDFIADQAIPCAQKAMEMTKDGVNAAKDKAMDAMDINRDGKVDIYDIVIMGLKVPAVRINREDFLRKELLKNYSQEVIDDAVKYNPAHAGITVNEIDKIADQVIELERRNVSGISAVLGVPGGIAMAAAIPADIAQYYAFMLRAIQKLLYLYGWPDLCIDNNAANIDSETMNTIIICFGVMYGVNGANVALRILSKKLAEGVEKKILAAALTKGTFYPMVKKIASYFAVHMNKEVFAGFFKNSIPVVGSVIGGGITYLSFKPCCDKLKKTLQHTLLSDPDNHDLKNKSETIDVEINTNED